MSKSCDEDRPCCGCGQEYLATLHDTSDRYEMRMILLIASWL
jgi:hypothetical protein